MSNYSYIVLYFIVLELMNIFESDYLVCDREREVERFGYLFWF